MPLMMRRCAIVLTVGLALEGCLPTADAGFPPPGAVQPAAPLAGDRIIPPPPPKPPIPAAKPAPLRPGPKPAPQPQPAAAPPNPDELVGLDEADLRKLLGSPAEIRNEGAARILSYRAPDCTLDVIMFLDVKTAILRVLSYDLAAIGPKGADSKACYGLFRIGT